ncbi:phosphatidylcholine and lysophosphatidylcholine phospholipase [Saitozyma podzolica]|uniref:Lysophospholipase NTE1 n=1 Tax=Saitozyma podzolica TaxID=1890683 RepID=A0A427YIV3_9TREE|nr:phosphatidylcholine and lysophosphatidylcholine phospholipase [Saitozyma podzolica]
MSTVPTPPDAGGNPLIALAVAVIYAILYVLQWVRSLVGWVTITVPSMVVRMLQYSLTISLNFPTLLGLFAASLGAAFFIIRYRYLARYTQLKEPALPPPSPPTLTTEFPSLATAGLTDRKGHGTFHNYLDDFLAAIRIFGYLEKPVFHELSRHLQTRRLAAGETLEIGGGEFWCVVEGKVQVFAPSSTSGPSHPPSPDPFETAGSTAYNGYHLLNEVSTGGTLSSLFSILSLFTEDIKVSWPPSRTDASSDGGVDIDGDGDVPDLSDPEMLAPGLGRRKSRANSDVSQMDEGAMSRRVASPDLIAHDTEAEGEGVSVTRPRSSSMGTASSTVRDTTSSPLRDLSGLPEPSGTGTASLPTTKSPSPTFMPRTSPALRQVTSFPSSPRYRTAAAPPTRPDPQRAPLSGQVPKQRKVEHPRGSTALKGTIARATVDTTLAVIPAEAFRKLTRKFPKASGTVVQVVLERFSRVTFMTAHKFLGLTREILRSESSLNTMVSHPLPRAFYTGGGMQALRDRFQPESRSAHTSTRSFSSNRSSPDGTRVKEKDYFNYVPASPTVKAPSLPSVTPKNAMTPATVQGSHRDLTKISSGSPRPMSREQSPTLGPGSAAGATAVLSPETAARHNSTFVRRASAMRKQVAAGDLAMTRTEGPDENGGAYYRPAAQTPGLPRMDTWRGRSSGSTHDLRTHEGVPLEQSKYLEDEYELREAVLLCIAKSIGLAQPTETNIDSLGRNSLAPSVSAVSTPNSPMFPANGRPARSPFGNVLDMMNASTHNDGVIGGMLREAVMNANAQIDDEVSSISASVHDSQMLGEKGVLRDLEGNVEVVLFKKGTALVKEGERSPGIYYVIDGFLEVSISSQQGGVELPRSSLPIHKASGGPRTSTFADVDERPFGAALGLDAPVTPGKAPSHSDQRVDETLFTVKPGGIAGYLASLCHTDSYVNITAKTDCFVGFLPNHALEKILERRPIVLLTLAKRLQSLLSPLVLHIDAALDWMQLGAGQVLYEKGEKSTDFYIVINGRLRSLDTRGNKLEVLREYGQNDSIGELDVITAANRSDTVDAIRDSELVRIPAALFDAISTKHPATTVQFLRLIASRVKSAMGDQAIHATRATGVPLGLGADVNLKTVCILGSTRSVPVVQFAGKLKTSLEDLGASTSYLDQGTVMRHLGRHAFARIGKLKVAGWLADQEQHYRTVLYVADTPPSSQWTLTCIKQADLILVVAMGDEPGLGEYEKLMLATKTTARKELILLHDERTVPPGSTRPWLKNRPWLHAHHHVELPGVVVPHKAPVVHDPAAVAAFKHLRERVETRLKAYRGLRPLGRLRRPPHMNDFARIARRLCGKQIGLVLGGGGARGISHIGMLQALEEFGIPIDAIGGCSIGSFVGGLYARETDLLETTGRTKQFSGRMGSMLRILSDVTYPFVAYTTGHEFNRGIYKAFYNTHIEDFWIPFFANSTNITHSRMEIHRSGYAWRYVRASMTLAGLLPPLSDNGNLLVDGGYMDNTPVGPLRQNGIRDIIVVDVGSIDDTSPRNYGDSVSGWWIFINRFNPFYERKVLSMTEISSRLTYVSSVKTLEDVKNTPGCLYMAMPVQEFDTLGGFKRFSEVLAIGLQAGRDTLQKWKAEGILPTGLVDEVKGAVTIKRGARIRRMSI